MNYFQILCIGWATVGIITRVLMVVYGKRWNQWEMEKAYSQKRPPWVLVVAGIGVFLVGLTWYQVFRLDVDNSWIIASLLTVTLVKIGALLFRYDAFRQFASQTLNDPKKKRRLTVSVFVMSLVMLWMGLFLYGGA